MGVFTELGLGIILVLALIVCGIAFLVFIISIGVAILKAKTVADNMNKDDAKPATKVRAKVLEKTADTRHVRGAYEYSYTTEWIVIEAMDGTRRKIRNTKTNEFFIAVGDIGEFTLRGETVYGFVRENIAAANVAQPADKIPAWQRVEMEKQAAQKAETENN